MFMVFFLVAYGLLTWGLIFAAQQSLSFAAEEGARSAQQWQGGAVWSARAQQARRVAVQRLSWVQQVGDAPAQIAVCTRQGRVAGEGLCSGATLVADQLEVVVRYPYASAPLLPVLPGTLSWLPTQLSARASVRLGGAVAGD